MVEHMDLGAADPCSGHGAPDQDTCQPGMLCHLSGLAAPVEPQIPALLPTARIRTAPVAGSEPVSHPPDNAIRPPIAL